MIKHAFTDSTFQTQVLDSKVPVVVYFWAVWCPPCKIIAPVMDELAKEYEGKVVIGKLNADENSEVVESYSVMSITTIMLFKNGEPVKSLVGARSKQAYQAEIEQLLN